MRHWWVDRVGVTEPGVRATGRKAVGSSEDFFQDHFPGNPVFPGIYLIEGMAQTAGVLVGDESGWRSFALMVSVDRARFSSFVRPGDVVEYAVEVEDRSETLLTVRGTATAGGRKVAQARITFQVLDLEEMIPTLYVEQWIHTLSLLLKPDGTGAETGHGSDDG